MHRFVIPEGTELRPVLDTVQQALGKETSWLQVSGRVSWIRLQTHSGSTTEVHGAEIIHWSSPSESPLEGRVCVLGDSGHALTAGVVVDATFERGVLVASPCSVVAVGRVRDATVKTGERPTPVEAPAPAESATALASAPPETPAAWADVAAASASAQEQVVPSPRPSPKQPAQLRGYDPDGRRATRQARKQRGSRPIAPSTPARVPEPIPDRSARRSKQDGATGDGPLIEKGDWVEHKVFGLCRVFGEDADGGLIIQLPSGARKSLKVDFFHVGEPRIENDRIIYPLHRRSP